MVQTMGDSMRNICYTVMLVEEEKVLSGYVFLTILVSNSVPH